MALEGNTLNSNQFENFLQIKGARSLQKKYIGMGMKGEGFMDDVGNWFKKTKTNVDDFLKKTKVISKAGSLAKYVLPLLGPEGIAAIPFVEGASLGLDIAGYGKDGMKGCGTAVSTVGGDINQPEHPAGVIDTGIPTVSSNGTFQPVQKMIFSNPSVTYVGPARPFAGPPQLSGLLGQEGGGSCKRMHMQGNGLGAFNTISGDFGNVEF